MKSSVYILRNDNHAHRTDFVKQPLPRNYQTFSASVNFKYTPVVAQVAVQHGQGQGSPARTVPQCLLALNQLPCLVHCHCTQYSLRSLQDGHSTPPAGSSRPNSTLDKRPSIQRILAVRAAGRRSNIRKWTIPSIVTLSVQALLRTGISQAY